MKPKIVSKERTYIVGMSFYGDPFSKATGWSEDNEIGILWQRFMKYYTRHKEAIQPGKKKNVFIELWIITDETETIGSLEVFVGAVVDTIEHVPLQCALKELPAIEYAVFTLQGSQITNDWDQQIYQEWLPAAGYESAYMYNFQYYDERFKGVDNLEKSEIDVYIPVKKKEQH